MVCKVFFIISCGLYSRVAYNHGGLHFFILSHWKALMTLSVFMATFCWPNSFCILFNIIPSSEGLWWTEGSCSGVSITMRVAKHAKRASMRKCVRGLGNLCLKCSIQSSAAYINILTPFRAAYNQGWPTIE